jgi:hypothetical protein
VLEKQKWNIDEGPRPNLNIVTVHGGVSGEIILSGPSEDLVIVRIDAIRGSVKLAFVN